MPGILNSPLIHRVRGCFPFSYAGIAARPKHKHNKEKKYKQPLRSTTGKHDREDQQHGRNSTRPWPESIIEVERQ